MDKKEIFLKIGLYTLFIVLGLIIGWSIVNLLVFLIAKCLGLKFSVKLATGIWLVLGLIFLSLRLKKNEN